MAALHVTIVRYHPGSSEKEVENEPDWANFHQHRIGYVNRQGRIPGITHAGDEYAQDEAFKKEAVAKHVELAERVKRGELVNFRDVLSNTPVRFMYSISLQILYHHLFPGRKIGILDQLTNGWCIG